MISVEVIETGVSLGKVVSDMPRLAKAILKKAGGVAITPDGNYAYVVNPWSDSFSVISTATNTITKTINSLNGPIGVAITPNGKYVYVTNNGDNSVWVISVDSSTTATPTPTPTPTPTTTATRSPTTSPTQTHDSPSPTVPEYHSGIAIVSVFVVATLVLAFVGRKCSKIAKG
jgi:YVTN family beta-propeller protein